MLYILHEKQYSETSIKIKKLISFAKKLSQKKIRVIELDGVDDAYSVLKSNNSVLFIPYEIKNRHKQLIMDCNECNVPVILANNYFNEFYNFYCSMIMGNMNYALKNLLKYFKYHNKNRVAVFGVNVKSDSDRKKVISLYSCFNDFNEDDVFYNKQYISDCFNEFYEKRYEYDSILCAHDFCAMAFIKLMNDKDPEYLKDRFIIGFSDTTLSKIYSTPLTTINFYEEEVIDALHTLYLVLRKRDLDYATMNMQIKNHIIIRESTQKMPFSDDPYYKINSVKRGEFQFPQFNTDVSYENDKIIADYLKIEDLLSKIDITDLKIIYYMLQGYKVAEMSANLYITEQTTKVYQRKILKNAGVNGKHELISLLKPYISLPHLKEYIDLYEKF